MGNVPASSALPASEAADDGKRVTPEVVNRLPRWFPIVVVSLSFLPFLLNQLGADFGIQDQPVTSESLVQLNPLQISDHVHHSLTGPFVHTLLEWSSTIAAFFTMLMAFSYFFIKGDIVTPIIGLALFCSGVIDAFHTLAADRMVFALADSKTLIPFTWAFCRNFNALITTVGVCLFLLTKIDQTTHRKKVISLISFALLLGFISYAIMYTLVHQPVLPTTMYKENFIHRPYDLGALVLFAVLGGLICPFFYRKYPGIFSQTLILSMIPQFMTQAHMTFGSTALFDNHFNIAHVLKALSYVVPFCGLVFEFINVVAKEKATQEELKRVNTNLESIVDQRTVELRNERNELQKRNQTIENIYTNVKSGFLIVNRNGTIEEGFTRSCYNLLSQDTHQGEKFSTALGLDERKAGHFNVMLEQVFEDFLPEDVLLKQVPSRFPIGKMVIKIEGAVIRDKESLPLGVLFTITDITELVNKEKENTVRNSLIQILKRKAEFRNFLEDTKMVLQECKKLALSSNQKRLRILIHTIKGNCGIFEMGAIANLIDTIEDQNEITIKSLQDIENAFREFLSKHQSILGLSYDREGDEIFLVDRQQVEALARSATSAQTLTAVKAAINRWVLELNRTPFSLLVEPVMRMGSNIASRLEKQVEIVNLTTDLKVDTELLRPIFQNLVHLIHNALDHGLESIEERGDKPKKGKIEFKAECDDRFWHIIVRDDGRGINTEKLVQRALASGRLIAKEAERLSREEKLKLIFMDGLSTADAVTDISGRGVGMSALAEAVKLVNGTISVSSEMSRGTTFKISVPIDPKELEKAVSFELAA
ncbi:MAG: hypothetical protein C5B49_07835 [Bdellovibrio sp.]|nr:MAG: hypothetical protein C5B49_07835 [Bdellovibrio sp.]